MFRRKSSGTPALASNSAGAVHVSQGFTVFAPKRSSKFLSDNFDVGPVVFEFKGNCTLQDLGVALVGGSSTDDRSANGIFIGNIEPSGRIARAAPLICKAFKIIGVNSFTITPDVAVADMGRMISSAPVIKMTVQYDPWGFAHWDHGEELRQVSNLAFQGVGPQHNAKMVVVRYLGQAKLSGGQSKGNDQIPFMTRAIDQITKTKFKGNPMDLGMSNFTITSEFHAKVGTVMGYQHPLFDVDNIHARASTIVIIVREFDRNSGQRNAVCHMYQCKSKDHAAQFAMAAVNKVRDGQRRVQVSVQRGRELAARAAKAAVEGPRSLKLDAASMGGNRNAEASGGGAAKASKRRGKGSTSSTGSGASAGGGGTEPSDYSLTLDAGGGGQITARQIGTRCTVDGYPTSGTIRFVGLHKQNRKPRVGVELDDQVGKNNGIVQGTLYFSCAPGRGLLVAPSKVTLFDEPSSPPAKTGAEEFGGFEDVGSGSPPSGGGGSKGSPRTENFGWTMTLTKDYSGGTPLNSSNRNSASEFDGFGDERISPEPETDMIEEEFDEEADLQADENARRRQSAIVDTEGDMVQSRGKCGKCGMPVFADQSRSRDKKTSIYYHETCPTRRLGAMAKDKIREKFAVGERCLFSEFNAPGVIRYIGPFGKGGKSTAGQMWIGIELDGPTGVHDGSVKGVKYFTAKPGHGMLVLPDQVKPAPRGGGAAAAALSTTDLDDDLDEIDLDAMDGGAPTVSEKAFPLLYVGSTVHHLRKGEKVSNRELARTCLTDILADDTNDDMLVDLKVSGQNVIIMDKKAEEAVQEHATAEVLYCSMVDAVHFVYITSPKYGTLRRQGAVRFVHAFTAKGSIGTDASRMLQTLIVEDDPDAAALSGVSASSRKLARKRSLLTEEDVAADAAAASAAVAGAAEEDSGAAEILLACRARVLGTVPVPKSGNMNQQVVTHAIATLAKREFSTPNVAIIVSEEGVRIIDEASQEQLNATLYDQMEFVCEIGRTSQLKPLQGKVTKWRKTVFAMVHSSQGGRTECELFSVGPKSSELVSTIADARKKVKKKKAAQAKSQIGPFAAVSKKVSKVEGPLAGMQIKRTSLIATVPLGQGQFGEVMCAEQLVGAGRGDDGSDRCIRACKLLRPGSSTEDRMTFLAELELNQILNHENLVQLVGVCIEARPWIAVLEFMPHGDIRKALLYAQDKGVQYTELEFLLMIKGVASGMEHIASLKYVHMDLAARNVLLGPNSQVKVADFGNSTKIPEGKKYYKLRRKMMISAKWAALESMTRKVFNEKTDVWSFGVCCWEILSYGAHPYRGVHAANILAKIRDDGYRLSQPEDTCSEDLYDLLTMCWDEDPKGRPKFKTIRRELEELVEELVDMSPPPRDIGQVANEGVAGLGDGGGESDESGDEFV